MTTPQQQPFLPPAGAAPQPQPVGPPAGQPQQVQQQPPGPQPVPGYDPALFPAQAVLEPAVHGTPAPQHLAIQQAQQAQQAQQPRSTVRTLNYADNDLHYPGQRVQKGITMFLFGAVGTWKTTFAATWPKPLFLSVGPEGGDDALAAMPEIYGLQTPPVYSIGSPEAMKEKVERVRRDYARMDINTVVVDSITYYVDMWISQLMELRYNDPKVKERMKKTGGEAAIMTMRDWGVLAMHIRDIAMILHSTPLNVIWIGLQREIKQSDETQGASRVIGVEPYIKGEMAVKLPGLCKMIVHADRVLRADMQRPGVFYAQPIYYTSPTAMTKICRHKYGNAFPEGKLMDPNPEYKDFPSFNAIYARVGRFVYMT